MVQQNLEDLTKEERSAYIKLKQWNPQLGDNFLVCIRKAKHWRRLTNLSVPSEAFSNVVDNEPCCKNLGKYVSSDEALDKTASLQQEQLSEEQLKLLEKALNSIERYRPKKDINY